MGEALTSSLGLHKSWEPKSHKLYRYMLTNEFNDLRISQNTLPRHYLGVWCPHRERADNIIQYTKDSYMTNKLVAAPFITNSMANKAMASESDEKINNKAILAMFGFHIKVFSEAKKWHPDDFPKGQRDGKSVFYSKKEIIDFFGRFGYHPINK